MSISLPELKEVVCLLMLALYMVVVAVLALMVISALRWTREARFREQLSQVAALRAEGGSRLFLERPVLWLAVKTEDIAKVKNALRLHETTACSWEEGLVEARDEKLFVSPAVAGWVLVVGANLPDPGEDVDRCYRFLTELSRKVGHLQFFWCNRVLNHHAWAIVDRGQIFRAYAWAGQTLWNQGPVTAAERDLKLTCFAYDSEVDLKQREAAHRNTEKIPQLASRWSVDPSAVAENTLSNEPGIVGFFTRGRNG